MTCTKPDVIIIRGAPGSGKTQASRCLATQFQKGVRVEIDTLRAMIISVDWTNQVAHSDILSLSTSLVLGFHRLGYQPVIVVDTFSGNKLATFLDELHSLDNSLQVRSFALVTAPEVLRVRVENRPTDQFKDIGICKKLNSEVIRHLQPIEQIFDNTALTPEETAEVILGQCAGWVARTFRFGYIIKILPPFGPIMRHGMGHAAPGKNWIPACAGMTSQHLPIPSPSA